MSEWQYKTLMHGGDYNPEQWLHMPEILEKDIEYLKKAHCDTVTLGVFSWAALEPEEGVYRMEWLKERIDRLYENGISVILATPTAARPKWMADRYPEVLRVNERGERNFFGFRHNHCYTSPVYREKTRSINMELAKHFGSHPAVKLWHISNELGGACYCPLCQQKFREWLKDRYQTIENLNRRWCTAFWSHTYQDFSQIEAPSSRGETKLHALNLDWKRFVTSRTRDFLEWEIRAVRDAGSTLPVTANLMYDYGGLDYRSLTKPLDIVSWDNYPTWHKKEEWRTALDCGMQHDIMRSLKKAPFLLMESCPSSTNWQGVSKLRKPGMAKAAALQAIAHGSESALYFQIRQSQGASEKFHGAVIDHYGGRDTRVFAEVTQTGEALLRLGEVAGSCCKAEAAILYDWENRWALEDAQGPRNDGLYYRECVQKAYNGLRRQGISVDFIGQEDELEDYRLLVIPMGYLLTETFAARVREFTAQGGVTAATYWTGIVDETDRCYLGGCPHGLMEVFGLRSEEIDGLYDWETNTMLARPEAKVYGLASQYVCRNLCDLVRPDGAETLMAYGEDFYAGYPALTAHSYGKGKAYYICADAEEAFYMDFMGALVKRHGLRRPLEQELPEGVEVTERIRGEEAYLFIQNFRRTPVEISLPENGWKLLYGAQTGTLGAFETVVLKKV